MEAALSELQQVQAEKNQEVDREQARVSTSEPEARMMKHGDRAIRPSYNARITTDAATKAIMATQLTQDANDMYSQEPAMDLVKRNMGREPEQVVADGGYTTRDNITAMKQCHIEFIGSLGDHAARQGAAVQARGIDPGFVPPGGEAVEVRAAQQHEWRSLSTESRRKTETEEAKDIYRQRGEVAEFPNAWIR